MPAAKLPGVDKLLGALDHLSHSERIREVVTLARAHRHDPALPVRLGELLARDSHAGALAVACVFDGRIGRREWALLERAYALFERATPRAAVLAFKDGLLSGDELGGAQLAALVPDLP